MNVDAYFDKPLVPAKLLAKIDELLGHGQPGDGAGAGTARGGTAAAGGATRRRRGDRLMPTWDNPLITIIGEKCRMCYACVRECPAKAIQVVDGQARVIQPRCIGCGNCLRVCSQNAKQVRDDTARAFSLLQSGERVVAMVAPSFPAEFTDIPTGTLVAMIRALGFDSVHEISLGADLVAHAYRRLLEEDPEGRYITTPCPASVSYVRKYHPRLMPYLAPIVSPMVAMARVLRHDLGPDIKVVFMGPCVAKKRASIDTTHVEVDAVLTFAELRDMFERRGIKPEDFAGRRPLRPAVRRARHGLPHLRRPSADRRAHRGPADRRVGRRRGPGRVHRGHHRVRPGSGRHPASRRAVLRRLFRRTGHDQRRDHAPAAQPCQRLRPQPSGRSHRRGGGRGGGRRRTYADLDLTREYVADAQTLGDSATRRGTGRDPPPHGQVPGRGPAQLRRLRLRHLHRPRPRGLRRAGRLRHVPARTPSSSCSRAYQELEVSHRSLEEAKEALERSGKLASMGQLAAGIAHEVNNPLGTLLLHANLLLEECEDDTEIKTDLETIVDQANRCKRIISGLLNFARQSRVVRQPTDVVGVGRQGHPHRPDGRERHGDGAGPPLRPRGRDRRRPDRPGAHQPVHQRPAGHARRRRPHHRPGRRSPTR